MRPQIKSQSATLEAMEPLWRPAFLYSIFLAREMPPLQIVVQIRTDLFILERGYPVAHTELRPLGYRGTEAGSVHEGHRGRVPPTRRAVLPELPHHLA